MDKLLKIEQMSESVIIATLMSLGGGFRDAYTYNLRGEVFANAQTGNIVLFGKYISKLNFSKALEYLVPIMAFAVGVYISELVKYKFKDNKKIHWRQIILFVEIIILISVGFMPHSMDRVVNVLISFVCAMQVESFRKFRNLPMATTMCTGNLRNSVEKLAKHRLYRNYLENDESEFIKVSAFYYVFIGVFIIGAGMGFVCSSKLGIRSIWIDGFFMITAFLIMFYSND